MKINILLVFCFITSCFAQAQHDTTFQKAYGGNTGSDVANAIVQTSDSGYVMAGMTTNYGVQSGGTYNGDVYLIKTNYLGDTLWTKTYGGTAMDAAYSLQQTLDGGFIIAGVTYSFGATSGGVDSGDVYLIKTNSMGDTLWTKTYGGKRYDAAWSVKQTTPDSGYIIAATTLSFGSGDKDFYVIKTKPNGDTLWTRTYGGSFDDEPSSITQASDGEYYVTGYTGSYGMGGKDIFSVKIYSVTTGTNVGSTHWSRTYGGTGYDFANAVQSTSDGGFILVGGTNSYGAGTSGAANMYVIKTNIAGDTLWTRTYGGTKGEEAFCVQQALDTGYVIGGLSRSFGGGNRSSAYVVKVNSKGTHKWSVTYGTGVLNTDCANGICQTFDKGYAFAGLTSSYDNGHTRPYLVKLDSTGANAHACYNHTATTLTKTTTSAFSSLTVAAKKCNKTSYVSRSATLMSAGSNIVTCNLNGIKSYNSNQQVNVFPNPSTGVFNIKLLQNENATAEVYDLVGKKVLTQFLPNGNSQINISNLSNGVYQLRIINSTTIIYQTKIVKQQ